MIETHAFGNFVPETSKYLLLGSFTGRQAYEERYATDRGYDWFYATKKNQFWPIIEIVYGVELRDKATRMALFSCLGIAIADTIYQCERKKGDNSDSNLFNIIYNVNAIFHILDSHHIKTILFSSRFAENIYKTHFRIAMAKFPNVSLMTLPSPSPRYFKLSKEQKAEKYRLLFPVAPDLRALKRYLDAARAMSAMSPAFRDDRQLQMFR